MVMPQINSCNYILNGGDSSFALGPRFGSTLPSSLVTCSHTFGKPVVANLEHNSTSISVHPADWNAKLYITKLFAVNTIIREGWYQKTNYIKHTSRIMFFWANFLCSGYYFRLELCKVKKLRFFNLIQVIQVDIFMVESWTED